MVVKAPGFLAGLSDPDQLNGDTTTGSPFTVAIHQLRNIPRGPNLTVSIRGSDEGAAKLYAGISEG